MSRLQPGGHELRCAAFRGDAQYVLRMLREGADVNSANETNGETALHKAVMGNKVNVMNVLLQEGADPDAATIGGFTPLHYCVGRDAAQVLLASGADPTQAGQGRCYAIGGQTRLYEQAGAARAHRLNGRGDVAAFIAQRAQDAARGVRRTDAAPRPPGVVLYMSPKERRQQLADQHKDWLVSRVLALEVELDRTLRQSQTAPAAS
jgi:ankyrin repeat protein